MPELVRAISDLSPCAQGRPLEEAQVVVYDYLCNPEILKWAPADAEIVFAGKKSGQHTLRQDGRATGITIYLENDGRLEHAQQMAGHESPRTTKLYDRTKDEITLSEVERIGSDS